MGDYDDLPAGWVVWSDEPDGRSVLAYRPDVFDSTDFPPECLPTLYVSQRAPNQGRRLTETVDERWYVTFYLEPAVRVRARDADFDTREEATAAAVETARAFDAGEIDYREVYQVPREDYFEKLDELTGGDERSDEQVTDAGE